MPQVVGKQIIEAIEPILAKSQHPPGIAASSGTPQAKRRSPPEPKPEPPSTI
jgi:hypothetical protein